VLQCAAVAMGCSGYGVVTMGRLCGSALQCVAVCCSVLQCNAVCCSVLQCVVVCCSVLQCSAVCCSGYGLVSMGMLAHQFQLPCTIMHSKVVHRYSCKFVYAKGYEYAYMCTFTCICIYKRVNEYVHVCIYACIDIYL